MYSLLLIDDEGYTLNNIRNSINWSSLGFTLTEAFSDSAKALEYIEKNDIDVIITDISMPNVSGIDIAKFCFYNKPRTKVILLSGYQDFKYAREGIQYKVFSYLTKPITRSDITKTLSELYSQLRTTNYNNSFIGNEIKSDLRRRLLSMLSGNIAEEKDTAAKIISGFGINIDFDNANYAIISFLIDDLDNFFQCEWTHGQGKLINTVAQLLDASMPNTYVSLADFYSVGFDILIISTSDVSESEFKIFAKAHTETVINTLFECIHMKTHVSDYVISHSFSDITEYCRSSYKSSKPQQSLDKLNSLQKALDYINTHYSEKIALDDVAKNAGFHPKYFSKLFTAQYGISFSDYVTKLRIDKAKELLINTDTKITAIPSLTGISDFANFSKRFKRSTGYLPSEYRNKFRKE